MKPKGELYGGDHLLFLFPLVSPAHSLQKENVKIRNKLNTHSEGKLNMCIHVHVWQIIFYLLDRIYTGSWYMNITIWITDIVFSSPCFSHLKISNSTSGWVKNLAQLKTGASRVVTSKQERYFRGFPVMSRCFVSEKWSKDVSCMAAATWKENEKGKQRCHDFDVTIPYRSATHIVFITRTSPYSYMHLSPRNSLPATTQNWHTTCNAQVVLTIVSTGLFVTGLVKQYVGLLVGVVPETHKVKSTSNFLLTISIQCQADRWWE